MSPKTIFCVSHAEGREVHVLEMNPDSEDLTLIDKVAGTGVAMPMAASPDRRYLYIGLLSGAASYMTGQSVNVTGGLITY